MKKYLCFIILMICLPAISNAQKIAFSTNFVDWANFLTYNGEIGIAVSRHFSIVAGGRYNNRQYEGENHVIVQNCQKTFYAGAKYWLWYSNTGTWVSAKAQYKESAQSGIWRLALSERKNVGIVLSGGYSILLSKHLNVDFGLGFWAGKSMEYTLYDCPVCLNVRDSGPRFFLLPDNLSITFAIVL